MLQVCDASSDQALRDIQTRTEDSDGTDVLVPI